MDLQWNRPSRDNWYQMQTALAVDRKFASSPQLYRLPDYKLPFKDNRPKKPLTSKERKQRTEAIKQDVLSMLGGTDKVTIVNAPIPEWIKKWLKF